MEVGRRGCRDDGDDIGLNGRHVNGGCAAHGGTDQAQAGRAMLSQESQRSAQIIEIRCEAERSLDTLGFTAATEIEAQSEVPVFRQRLAEVAMLVTVLGAEHPVCDDDASLRGRARGDVKQARQGVAFRVVEPDALD